MLIIIDVLDSDHHFNTDRFIEYFYTVIKNENTKNSLGEFLSQNFGMLAYQIAEHKGRKGESYISSTQGDFMRLFRSAMGGGVIVSFVAIFKNYWVFCPAHFLAGHGLWYQLCCRVCADGQNRIHPGHQTAGLYCISCCEFAGLPGNKMADPILKTWHSQWQRYREPDCLFCREFTDRFSAYLSLSPDF
jgi:hypothetical protein